jgi:hypothetical protein
VNVATKAVSVAVHIDGARPLLAAFRKLPKQASDDLRDGSLRLSKTLAQKIKAAGLADSDQAAAVAPTVKAVRDRVPAITIGGSTRVTSRRVPASAILFGSEFGARRRFGWYSARKYRQSAGRQYRRHLGRGSYWIYKTVDHNSATISKAWLDVADHIVGSFARGGS